MCGRKSKSTTRPETSGPLDTSFGYRVTEEGMKALAEYEERHGKAVLQKVEHPTAAPHSVDTETRHEKRRRRRTQARARGHRLITVCGKWRGNRKIPDLRLLGLWLEKAGFDLGQQCEVEVESGTLTIRAV